MQAGLKHQQAPELRVSYWIDSVGKETEPLKLANLGSGYKILYCFQHWCPGCHERGFPTLGLLVDNLADQGFGFAVVQTVFEGADANTVDKLRVNQERYGLAIPFGHDVPLEGERLPSVMQDYQTGGTPWFTVIDPEGNVVYADFSLDPDRFIATLGQENFRHA